MVPELVLVAALSSSYFHRSLSSTIRLQVHRIVHSMRSNPGESQPSGPQDQTMRPRRGSTPRPTTLDELRRAYNDGCCLTDELESCFKNIFESFWRLNANFALEPESVLDGESDVDVDKLTAVYDILVASPENIRKLVVRLVARCLLQRKPTKFTRGDLKAFFCLLLNPLFDSRPTILVFAHLLRQVAELTDEQHYTFVLWFKTLEKRDFSTLVVRLQNFICRRQFSRHGDGQLPWISRHGCHGDGLPAPSKSSWWIPCATRILALLNAANNMCQPPIVSYLDFYIHPLDKLDLLTEYQAWQNPAIYSGFSFCQYPFILSIAAKRAILQNDSHEQMLVMARRTVVAKLQRNEEPKVDQLFLTLTIRRSHLVSDSLNEIAAKQFELKKKLRVKFSGEPGLDMGGLTEPDQQTRHRPTVMGGLTKEWFLLLVRKIFQPDYGLFTYNEVSRIFWFSNTPCENFLEYNLVGVLMGLAVYNGINLDIHFPAVTFRKLLSPAVVPYNDMEATVGVVPVTIDDLHQVAPVVARSLQDLLTYEGDVEKDFDLTFEATVSELPDQATSRELKPGGKDIPVTNHNRQEYVQLYTDYVLNRCIYNRFKAFYHGFQSVCASNALIMLRPEEVELLVCGNPTFSFNSLVDVTEYSGYTPNDVTISNFWQVVLTMSEELQKKLLLFATGSDRLPVGGISEMNFKITRAPESEMLPTAHTCFNQLVLPAYQSKKILKQKLMIAIQNAEGFGLK